MTTLYNGRGTRPRMVLRPNYAEPFDCPECGRWLTRTTSGALACFYSDAHRSGREVYLTPRQERAWCS